ncbi:hypothetical protein AB0M38_29695 [Streptomyces sp. NPDC051742]|uniref:hypothetical protein n=1 Tax=unclassified Streptomyces TaxID=2593676 RepID=UPI003430450C
MGTPQHDRHGLSRRHGPAGHHPIDARGNGLQVEITGLTFSPDGLGMAFIAPDGAPDIWTAADNAYAVVTQENVDEPGSMLDGLD